MHAIVSILASFVLVMSLGGKAEADVIGANRRVQLPEGSHWSQLVLPDQFGKENTIRFPRESVSVFLVSGKAEVPLVKECRKRLLSAGIRADFIHGVASLGDVPDLFRFVARSYVEGVSTESVLMDWDGVFPQPKPGKVLIRLLAKCGRIEDFTLRSNLNEELPVVLDRIRELCRMDCSCSNGNKDPDLAISSF